MQLYSASPLVRTRQVVADVVALTAIVVAAVLGTGIGTAIAALGGFGRSVEEAGDGLRRSMSDAASTLGGIPVLGDAAAAPFEEASGVGASLAASGQDQQRLMTTLGVTVGLIVAVLPIALVLAVWLRRRIAFARRARATARLAATLEGRDLLALRALVLAPSARLLALASDPATAWRERDPATVAALADLELKAAGVIR
ncbi:hypothetical protein [Naasia sp. SYSU D00948]|uniref:hypothetical protein n=1 Tax=Naasia sp. SYSU D00948 TaxID=2817379 RepID=UPI001B3166D5|nr:hypothetical protein [Naasia sp. SYSU D00948]